MSAELPRVTTRQQAFLEAHGIDPATVPQLGLGIDGIEVVGRTDHPWAVDGRVIARAGDLVRTLLPYPDDATRDAATTAQNEDWAETVGPETAALWRGLAR